MGGGDGMGHGPPLQHRLVGYAVESDAGRRVLHVQVDVPTRLIWGEHDIALGIERTHNLEPWVPNLQIKYIPDSGHWVQQEQPEKVNQYMLEFLQKSKEQLIDG